jgi:uncharacterized protein
MLNSKIYKQIISEDECGLFANDFIRENEFIWMPHPSDSNLQINLSLEEISKLNRGERDIFLRFCYQVDINRFAGYLRMEDVETDDANFMNHSCDPNSWYSGEILVARRNIMPDEEITYDYATDCTGRDWGFKCGCGSGICRGIITRDDWKNMQSIYGNHFIHYINTNYIAEKQLAGAKK